MKQLILFIFIFTIFSNSYAVSRDDFLDLFRANGVNTLLLEYDKKSLDQLITYFSGSDKISGVLVYHYYIDDIAIPAKWRFIFYPDGQERINLKDGYSFDSIILLKDMSNKYMSTILSDSINISDDEFKKIFGEKYAKKDRNIIGGLATHVELTINNLQIINELGYAAQFNSSYIKPTGKVKKWYLDANQTSNTLCLITNDDYANFRASPGGKILFKVYKNDLNDDNSNDINKGYLIEMPTKDFHSDWVLVLFLKSGEPTWERGALGYIHKSQIDYCEYILP
ncbi:hypothetical protein [Mucispirillum schaedleri]|uniref:hypothetical protein n=1 Tax=Mucispirillum schaedleri TaxID=248039 RepID=UPI001F55B2BE|nr:hypothetical protein [Mucispirillum schaedleri]